MIIWASVLLNVDSEWRFDNLRGSHLFFGVKVSCIKSVETLVIGQIGQLSLNVIGHLSLKLWCYWLWRLEMWLVLFDPSFLTAGRSLIVSQIVLCQLSTTVLFRTKHTQTIIFHLFMKRLLGSNLSLYILLLLSQSKPRSKPRFEPVQGNYFDMFSSSYDKW